MSPCQNGIHSLLVIDNAVSIKIYLDNFIDTAGFLYSLFPSKHNLSINVEALKFSS